MVVLAVWPSPPAMCHLKQKVTVRSKGTNLRVANHQLEVVVAIDASGHVLVVVLELRNRHDLISLLSFPDSHEVGQHFVGSLTAALEVWVEAHVVGDSDIIDSHQAAAVLVEHGVRLVDHITTTLAEVTSDGAQKFIE